jgi:hypothetical protein
MQAACCSVLTSSHDHTCAGLPCKLQHPCLLLLLLLTTQLHLAAAAAMLPHLLPAVLLAHLCSSNRLLDETAPATSVSAAGLLAQLQDAQLLLLYCVPSTLT